MLAQGANAANKEKFAVCLGQLKWSTTLACSDLAHGVSLWSMTDPRSSKPPWYIIVFHNTWLRVWAFIYFMMIFLMVLFLHLLHTPRSCMLTWWGNVRILPQVLILLFGHLFSYVAEERHTLLSLSATHTHASSFSLSPQWDLCTNYFSKSPVFNAYAAVISVV